MSPAVDARTDVAITVRGGGRIIPAEWADNLRATNERIDAILGSAS